MCAITLYSKAFTVLFDWCTIKYKICLISPPNSEHCLSSFIFSCRMVKLHLTSN